MESITDSMSEKEKYKYYQEQGKKLTNKQIRKSKVKKVSKVDTCNNGIDIKEKDSIPIANVPKEKENTERNVVKEDKKMSIIDEEIKRKYKIESHEQIFAYDTAVEYDDLRSIGNYLKRMRELGLSRFQQVKTYVEEMEGVKDRKKYFTTMAKLEFSTNAVSKPKENDKNKSKNDKKVDKKK